MRSATFYWIIAVLFILNGLYEMPSNAGQATIWFAIGASFMGLTAVPKKS